MKKDEDSSSFKKIAFAAMVLLLMSGCAKKIPPDLARAKDIVADFVAPLSLQNSMFAAAYPDCKPSQLVHYMFTGLAAAELPEVEHSATETDTPPSEESGAPGWPAGVEMVALNPDPAKGRQLVLKADDAKEILILEVYDDPAKAPLATYEVKVAKVTPSALAKAAFQSNIEMGATY